MTHLPEDPSAPCIGDEFSSADFGDKRLSARVIRIAEACAQDPTKSFPRAMTKKGDCEAAYRFFANEVVTSQAVLQPHVEQTIQRAAAHEVVLVLHDTTEFEFSTDREGLGYLRQGDHGFLFHCSLAVTADGSRRPLGVLGTYTWTRKGKPRRRSSGLKASKDRSTESARWHQQVVGVEKVVDGRAELIHVTDREGDAYPFVASMSEAGARFIVRMARDRTARENEGEASENVLAISARGEEMFEMKVPIARRAKKDMPQRKSMGPRDGRTARLIASATTMEIKRPPYLKNGPAWLELNVVRVREDGAPDDALPIDWVLFTSEPIETSKDVAAILDRYCARWLIEEFFKAIKTGCEYEKLQLESLHALENALALFLPIAWRMLLLRNLARTEPQELASTVLTKTEIEVLYAFPPMKLPRVLTVGDAFLAVAMMGGYMKHKKPPGWLTLARGFEKLTLLEMGWSAARRKPESDVMDP